MYQRLMDPDSECMAGLRTRYLELWEFSRLGIIAELDSKILVTIHIINYILSILETEALWSKLQLFSYHCRV